MEELAMQLEAKQGRIIMETEGDALLGLASPEHLSIAVRNVLDNAIKYCDTRPEILLRIVEKKDWISVSIRDNGRGMDRKTLRQVFERFFRATQGNIHNVKGFGLGLSYVKAVMNAMNGNIEVTSEEGKGSTFTLYVQVAQKQKQ
jgi:two-component system phosphate regulon sensor histidine kinase PhoR